MITFYIIATVILSLYAAGTLFLIVGVLRSGRPISMIPDTLPPVSIIIPMRNEAHNLKPLLDSLRKQAYPGDYEIILVNDGSSDDFRGVVAQAGSPDAIHIVNHVFDLKAGINGFEQAVRTGGAHAKFDFAVIAAADMIMHETWLASLMLKSPRDSEVIIAHTAMAWHKRTFFIRMQMFQREFLCALRFAWVSCGLPCRVLGEVIACRTSALATFPAFPHHSRVVTCVQPYSVSAITCPEIGLFPFINHSLRTLRSLFQPFGGIFPVGLALLLQNSLFIAALTGALPRRLALFAFLNWALTYIFCAITFRKMRSAEDPISFLPFFPVLILQTIWFIMAFVIQPRVHWKQRMV